MFKIGQVVFCPLRGTGTVEAIETRTVLNETKEYIIIQMKSPSLTMMIPTDRVKKSPFRKLNDETVAREVETILFKKEIEIDYSVDIKKRTKINQEKLSTGSMLSCGEIVRDLSCMEHIKALNNVERGILMQAKKLLVDELSIIRDITTEETEENISALLQHQ